jgi:type II secretory pathway pseudopilin PulG
MSSIVRSMSARLRRQEGFTLVELLAAMAAGMVVLAGLVTVISVTIHQTTATFTRIDATERARSMLNHVQDELHSACLANGVTPIEGGAQGTQVSDANNLVFVSQFGTSASPTPVEHKITYSPSAKTLTEFTYSATTAGSDPTKWVFSSTPVLAAGRLLLTNVTQISVPTTLPVFQYFAYEQYTDKNGNAAMMLMDGSSPVLGSSSFSNPYPLPVPLTTGNAAATAEVMVNLLVGAQGGSHENSQLTSASDPVTDSIVLRFTPPPNAAGGTTTFGPCS